MARSFNGTTDQITVSTGFNLGTQPFTMAAWCNYTGSTQGAIIGGAAASVPEMAILTSRSVALIRTNVAQIAASVATITASTWQHVGITVVSGTNSNFYVNGAFDSNSSTISSLSSGNIFIGRTFSNEFFPGQLADVACWSAALTTLEFLALWRGVRPNKIRPASLIHWEPLAGDVSPEPDLSGNRNNGTLTGTAKVFGPPVMMFTPRPPTAPISLPYYTTRKQARMNILQTGP